MADMKVEAWQKYKRRGRVCFFTFRLTWEAPLKDEDGGAYVESWHWAYLTWDGADWQPVGDRHSHRLYVPPREPTMDEIRLALHRTDIERRALKSMGIQS